MRVTLARGPVPGLDRSFGRSFRVGRDPDCEVQLDVEVVSRVHLEVACEQGRWWVRDLGSTNGTFVDGQRIENVCVEGALQLELSNGGPVLQLAVESGVRTAPRPAPAPPAPGEVSVDHYIQHYLKEGDGAEAGEHTRMIRRAFARVQKKQRRTYWSIVAAALGLVAVIAAYAVSQHLQLVRHQEAAAAVFDDMKALDVQIAQLQSVIEGTGNATLADQLQHLEESRRGMVRRYDAYLDELGVYGKLSEDEKAIYKMARAFNESEFGMPAGFAWSVQHQIEAYWQTPAGKQRFVQAIRRAERNGYTADIVKTLRKHGLPPQLFYVALQESNFDQQAIGPLTRWGRAKGMWQLVPATARLYGLNPGPRPDSELIDARDERHDFKKSTDAAARYLQTIYGTLAQASGLLVIASYNWGEHRVADKLDQLADPQVLLKQDWEGIPENPSVRNYWRFLGEYKNRMPQETKDYVLKIFSAAVIGENPRRFGIEVDNPLARYTGSASTAGG